MESAIAREKPIFEEPEIPEVQPGAEEFNLFKREVGRLIAGGHKGRFALLKGNAIRGVWDESAP